MKIYKIPVLLTKLTPSILWKIPTDKIAIQYKKGRNSYYTTIVPKEVNVNSGLLITTLGLLKGEMRKRKDVLSFSNTEPFLLNYVLKCFEYFGLKKSSFDFNIQINTKNCLKLNKNKLLEFWSEALSINKESISDNIHVQ